MPATNIAFRDAVKLSMLLGKSQNELASFKKLKKELFEDTLRQAYLVFTTLSKAADIDLTRFLPSLESFFIDEECQATELETLLP